MTLQSTWPVKLADECCRAALHKTKKNVKRRNYALRIMNYELKVVPLHP